MARIVVREDAASLLAGAVNPALWTALIPAAGRGTRLGFDKPKILFPVSGATILERLGGLLSPLCDQFVLVLSPDGAPVVKPEMERLLPQRSRVAIQPSPRGMGDAVARGLSEVRTANVLIVWGDQFALKSSSLEFCMRLLEGAAQPAAVCPTLLRTQPYIHFERDSGGAIVRVLQQREGDSLPSEGESDSGVFFFRTAALRSCLAELLAGERAIGRLTGEQNFLPIFPLIDTGPDQLITARIMSTAESVGVNSRADAEYLETRGGV
jgi:bifunctional N-acetylglucosamine-1-phosphate-uridyltransferase/glucosamine-1-phosphate-acetyltransferase GlmU-like protein